MEPGDVLGYRDQPLGGHHVHELAQEQRIPARLLPAGVAKGVVGRGGEGLAYDARRGLTRERRGPDHGGKRVGDDPVDELGILSGLRLSQADEQRDV